MLASVPPIADKTVILDFMIWTLGQQIAADGLGRFSSGLSPIENRYFDFRNLFPSKSSFDPVVQKFDLSRIPAYTGPWDHNRFPKGIRSILTQGYRHELSNHKGIYFKELHFAVMLEGRHHPSLGIFMGECIVPLEVLSLEPYFAALTTDGAHFQYLNGDGSSIVRETVDYRFAAMYRLAQIKWEYGYPVELRDWAARSVQDDPTKTADHIRSEDLSELESLLLKQIEKNAVLKREMYLLEQEAEYWKRKCQEKNASPQGCS